MDPRTGNCCRRTKSAEVTLDECMGVPNANPSSVEKRTAIEVGRVGEKQRV